MSDEAVQAACIEAAAQLLIANRYPVPPNVSTHEAVAEIAERIYDAFRKRVGPSE